MPFVVSKIYDLRNERPATSMNFLLRKLEAQVEEADLLRGEELFEAGAVQPLQEIERHLWVGAVREGETVYEVEVKISPSRVLAGTCECQRFQEQDSCEHFVATLLALRRQLRRIKDSKEKKRGKQKSSRKLTTAIVLDNVDHYELVNFVKEYARTHRNFAIALKARFTSNVGSIDTKAKFLQLLDSTVSLARRPDRTISQRGLQKIVKVIDELRAQSEEALTRQHYAEAVSIAQSIIEKVTPVLSKVKTSTDALKNNLFWAFQLLKGMADTNLLPPALQSALRRYCLQECRKLTYRNNQMDRQFLQLYLQLAETEKHYEDLSEAIEYLMDKYLSEFRDTTPLLLLKLRVLEQAGKEAAAQELVENNLLQTGVLRHAIEQAERRGDLERARMLIHKGLEADGAPERVQLLEDQLLRIAARQGDKNTQQEILEKRFLQRLDLSIYRQLRDLLGEKAALSNLRRLIEHLRQKIPTRQRNDILAHLLAEACQKKELLEHLRQCASLRLLQQYDEQLLPEYEEELLLLYRDLLQDYVQNHLGPKSSRRIRETLDHLHQIGMKDLAARLVQEFRTSYPERHTLMEELAFF